MYDLTDLSPNGPESIDLVHYNTGAIILDTECINDKDSLII
jgi:hypothetical protein